MQCCYTPVDVELKTPGGRLFFLQAIAYFVNQNGRMVFRKTLKVPPALANTDWVNCTDGYGIYPQEIEDWLLAAIFGEHQMKGTFPMEPQFSFLVLNPEEFLQKSIVPLYKVARFSTLTKEQPSPGEFCFGTVSETLRNFISQWYPKYTSRCLFVESGHPAINAFSSLTPAQQVLLVAMMYAVEFHFPEDAKRSLQPAEWAERVHHFLPWSSVLSRMELLQEARLPENQDKPFLDLIPHRLQQELDDLMLHEERSVAARQVLLLPSTDVYDNLPLVCIGTSIDTQKYMIALPTGTLQGECYWGVHFNESGHPIRTLLGIKVPAEGSFSKLYQGPHVRSLLLSPIELMPVPHQG